MIIVYHSNNRIAAVCTAGNKSIPFDCKKSIANGIHIIAKQFPNKKIIWCNTAVRQLLNIELLLTLMHHDKMMLSYSASDSNFLDRKIGYVEESLFISCNKTVSYPTWQMSSVVGAVHATVLNIINDKIVKDFDFDYYLNSIAKVMMPKGLLCYSEPKLLKKQQLVVTPRATIYTLFRFVKQHYKARWVFLLLFNLMIYERKYPILPFLFSFFYKNRITSSISLDSIKVKSSRKVIDKGTIDVIIPTIGRKDYLYDVLKDFSKQTRLPNKIIIVEQNPEEGSDSELDYLINEKWPFEIKHIFTHQSGACNARNLALDQTMCEWVFLADDDIRIPEDFILQAFENINNFGTNAVSVSCLQKDEKQTFDSFLQWGSFGSGCSIVKTESLKNSRFNIGYEFGYGEDSDFGMQLRNHGCDVLYLPYPEILHLKAPVGGFRTKPVFQWHNENIQPKPSPTVMLYILSNNTREQLLGYKTTLFFKFYKHQIIKNPIRYMIHFQKQWKQSVFWANQLKANS